MTPDSPYSGSVPRRSWVAWSALLVFVSFVVAALGWHRTLLDTETWALYNASQPFASHLQAIRGDLVHPPLSYLLQRAWLQVLGQTDTAARAFPLVVTLPAIVLLTLLATRIAQHWRLLSFFLATLFFHAGAAPSQVRMYGLAVLLSVSALLLWDNWRANPRNSTLVAWTVVTTLLVYTHLFGSLFVVAFVLLNWLFGRRPLAFTLAASVPALAFLPWFLYVLPVYHSRGLQANLNWVHQSFTGAAATLLYNFLGGFDTGSYRLRWFATAVAVLIHLFFVWLCWRNRSRFWPLRGEQPALRAWFWIALLLAAVPLIFLMAFSLLGTPAFEARFVLGAMIPYLIAVFLLCQLSGRAGRILLLAVLLPWRAVEIGASVIKVRRPSAVRQGVEFVARQVRPGDLLLANQPSLGPVLFWEWNRRLGRSERLEVLWTDSPSSQRMTAMPSVPLRRLPLDSVSRVWLFQRGLDDDPDLQPALAARGFLPAPQVTAGVPRLLLFVRKTEN